MKYRGSCHCGKAAYEVEADIPGVLPCNCSLCSRRGSLLTFVPRSKFNLLQGDDALTLYTFNKHLIQHRFCNTCGIQSFAFGKDPKGNEIAAINVRCLENFDFTKLPVQHFDGRSI